MIHCTFKLKIIKSQVGREEFPTYTLSYEMKKKSNFDGCQMSDKNVYIQQTVAYLYHLSAKVE